MFAFPSYKPAFERYRASDKVALFQDEVNYILDAYENGAWYWYGMEAGLNGLSAYIESTGIFGEALQGRVRRYLHRRAGIRPDQRRSDEL